MDINDPQMRQLLAQVLAGQQQNQPPAMQAPSHNFSMPMAGNQAKFMPDMSNGMLGMGNSGSLVKKQGGQDGGMKSGYSADVPATGGFWGY